MCRLLVALVLLPILTGCPAWTEKMATFETVITQTGNQTIVCTKHGARVIYQTDAAQIEVDDRGHPEQPGILSSVAALATARAINDSD